MSLSRLTLAALIASPDRYDGHVSDAERARRRRANHGARIARRRNR
jgi:hypothetical protein